MLTAEAKKFIYRNKEKPFFLYVAYVIPHSRLQIPAEDECFTQYKDQNWPLAQQKHAGMISRMDSDIGSIMDYLKELELAENTLVIFTSDNGAHNSGGAKVKFFKGDGKLRGIKRNMYEGGIRVPFVAWWPGTITAGRRSAHLGAHWDLMPTACEIAAVPAPANIDGISYLPLLKNELTKQKKHKYLYFELHRPTKRGIRMGDWVCLQEKTSAIDPDVDKTELYNLKTDLGQKNDLAGRYPEKLQEMKNLLKEAHTPAKHFAFGKRKTNKKSKSKKKKK